MTDAYAGLTDLITDRGRDLLAAATLLVRALVQLPPSSARHWSCATGSS